MQFPGEYAQPLTRTTEVRVPIIAGCVTARLRSLEFPTGGSETDADTQVLFKNTGDTQITVQFQETDDHVNGPFNHVGQSVTLIPGGQSTIDITPSLAFLELAGLSGTGEVNVRISSQIQFQELGFDKTEGRYPSSLWKADYPGWSTLL